MTDFAPMCFPSYRGDLDPHPDPAQAGAGRPADPDGHPTVPVRVDYELTDLGRTLVPVLVAVKTWSETHIEEVMAARDAFEEEK